MPGDLPLVLYHTVAQGLVVCFHRPGDVQAGGAEDFMQSRSSHATVSAAGEPRSAATHAAHRPPSAAAASSPIGISHAVAEFDAVGSPCTTTPGGRGRGREVIEPGSGRSSDGMSQQLEFLMSSMRSKIQNAVSEMQAQLQEELQEEDLKIHHVLGQGAFGTVYHGALPLKHIRGRCRLACCALLRTDITAAALVHSPHAYVRGVNGWFFAALSSSEFRYAEECAACRLACALIHSCSPRQR